MYLILDLRFKIVRVLSKSIYYVIVVKENYGYDDGCTILIFCIYHDCIKSNG